VKVVDILDTFHYVETSFGKQDYVTFVKAYLKKVKGYLEEKQKDRVEPFMKGAQAFVKWVVENFKEF